MDKPHDWPGRVLVYDDMREQLMLYQYGMERFWTQVAIFVLWQTIWDMGVWGHTPAWTDEIIEAYVTCDGLENA